MIKVKQILKMLGQMMALFNLSILAPILVSLIYQDGHVIVFLKSMLVTSSIAGLLYMQGRSGCGELRNIDAFLLVSSCWVVLIITAAIPFILSEYIPTVMDAIFEATSGITTTGVEVIGNLDLLPESLLFYHQMLQFIGGLGIIILALAIMPMIGMGGLQVYRAEITGSDKDNKLAPRLRETAKSLWSIYLSLTILCILSFRFAGMDWFNAICESFGTVSTGGFSIHNDSFAFHDSYLVGCIAAFFMLASSIGFQCHYQFFQRYSKSAYLDNIEAIYFIKSSVILTLITSFVLYQYSYYPTWYDCLYHGFFNIISMATTTGLSTEDFSLWPSFLPVFILLGSMMGGCSGSTTGGLKFARVIYIYQEMKRTLLQLIHPQAIISLKLGHVVIHSEMSRQIRGYIFIFVISLLAIILMLMATHMDFYTAFASAVACLSCAGDSVAGVANGYGHLSSSQKGILTFAMLLGRIEILSLMVIFLPEFWRS